MPHRKEELLTELYRRFSQGDLPGVLAMCDDAIEFHVPGAAPFSGVYTKETFPGMVMQVMQISGGTFGERPVTIIANDDHGIAVLDHWLERDGRRIEYRTDHLWQFKGDKLSRWEERPGSQAEFEAAWG
jgi:ketosteroid isomerase-like protein